MKRNILAILALSLSLASCESSNQEGGSHIGKSSGMSSIEMAILENNQSYALSEKYRGDMRKAQLVDIKQGSYGVPAKKSKTELLLQAVTKIDKRTEKSIRVITELKTSILKKAGCKDCIVLGRGDIRTGRVNVSKINNFDRTAAVEVKDLYNDLFVFAKEITSVVAGSQVKSDRDGNVQYLDRYSFQLRKFAPNQPLQTQIDQQLNENQVNPEDDYTIKDILLGVLQSDFPTGSISVLDAINYLTIVERRILTGRALAISTIRSRVAG